MYYSSQLGFGFPLVISGVAIVLLVALVIYMARQRSATELVPSPTLSVGHETHHDMTVTTQSHRSFNLVSDASDKNYQANQSNTYTFSIVDDQDTTTRDFAMVHERIMHVIIVRKDLQAFQHLHPVFDQTTGQFTVTNLTFPSEGPYRIFLDFNPVSAQREVDGIPSGVVLYEDVRVGDIVNYRPQFLADTALSKTFQNYQVQLTATPTPIAAEQPTTLTFAITQNGRPITNLEQYLGALGHSVVLREGDLEFLHTHALDGNVANQTGLVDFAVTFPSPGKYKAFSQFQHRGQVILTEFVLTVQSASSGADHAVSPDSLEHIVH